jgi:GTP pyrophosphokinase
MMTDNSVPDYTKYFDINSVADEAKEYLSNFDLKKFLEAFAFAEKHHRGQIRKNGEPYIVHPVETVKNLLKLRADEDTLITALLHDVPEDTECDLSQIKSFFGENVAFLVDGITKLSKVYYRHDMEERQVESLKKLLIHTAKDPRVILVKLSDRLHNMQTLEFISKPEKRERISKETLEIYVPIANLLGIQDLKSNLEDLCFKFLYPEDFEKLRERIALTTERYKGVLDEMIKMIKEELKKHDIKAKVYGREKGLYSIYKKIKSENKSIDDIHDRLALRIITKNKADCYTALGVVHDIFNPKPGKFKDYIAVPKFNGYQSIHTTVLGINGVLTEIQIRTEKMHMDAEYGIAAHYFYDRKKENFFEDQRTSWAAKVLEAQGLQKNNEDFISNLKIDIFQDRIFVFTPKGETLDLPKNATAIDFAYAIHSDLGNHAVKAEINNEIKPITTTLKTGDHINIITSNDTDPQLLWLSFAKTNVARNKIKLFLKKESLNKKVDDGMDIFQKELDRAGLGLIEDINFKKLRSFIMEKINHDFETKRDLFAAIGDGSIQAVDVIKFLKQMKNILKGETKVAIKIIGKDRPGLMKDVIDVLIRYNADFSYSQGYVSLLSKKAIMIFYIKFRSINDFSEVCQYIEQIEGVEQIHRLFKRITFSFYSIVLSTIAVWALHPLFIRGLMNLHLPENYKIFSDILLYLGLFMLLFTIVNLKRTIRKTFPTVKNVKWVWTSTFLASTFAVFVLLVELVTFKLRFNWIIIFGGILFMYTYLAIQYFDYVRTKPRI